MASSDFDQQEQKQRRKAWKRVRRILKPDRVLFGAVPEGRTSHPREKVVQWLILLIEFSISAWIGLAFFAHGFVQSAGAIFVALVTAAICLYLWQPTVWGRYRSMWWLKRALPSALTLLVVGFVLGLRVHQEDQSASFEWHTTWIFSMSISTLYMVIWGFIRTILLEAVERCRR